MSDNFFKGCPPVMEDGRLFTDYRMSHRREQYNKSINGIVRDDEYRLFLQNNAENIMDKEWEYNRANNSCFVNVCAHNYPTRTPPGALHEEMELYNAVKTGKPVRRPPVCEKFSDYRASVTGRQ